MLFSKIDPLPIPAELDAMVHLIKTGCIDSISRYKHPIHNVCAIPAILSDFRIVYSIVDADDGMQYYLIWEKNGNTANFLDVLNKEQFEILHRYSIRYNDEGCPDTVEDHVAVNHLEDFITVVPIAHTGIIDGDIELDGEDGRHVAFVGYTRPHLTINQFADKYGLQNDESVQYPRRIMEIEFCTKEEASEIQQIISSQLRQHPEYRDGMIAMLQLDRKIIIFNYLDETHKNAINITIPIT